jgi:hypothetical protein
MSVEAMKEALEALEDAEELLSAEDYSTAFQKEAITALRQAIAEAEKPDLARVGEVGVWGKEKNT